MAGEYTRRRALKALGVAGAVAVPGCLGGGSTTPADEEKPDQSGDSRPNILKVHVTGYQFGWEYEYHSGLHSDDYEVGLDVTDDNDALVLPKNEPVQLTFSSRDVPHNYGVPEVPFKRDVLPDKQTLAQAYLGEVGVYEAQCFELCGRGHSNMDGDLVVTEPKTFTDWYLSQDGTAESDLHFMSDVL
jgi:cytochrome c oxidase subunit 2